MRFFMAVMFTMPVQISMASISYIHGHGLLGLGCRCWRKYGMLLVSPGPRGGVLMIGANGEASFLPNDDSCIDSP